MSDKSAKPILIAGAVGTVVLLGVAWMFAASAGEQARLNAVAYAESKQAEAAAAPAVAETAVKAVEETAVAEVAEVKVEEPAVAEVAEEKVEEPAVAEAAEVKVEEPAVAAPAAAAVSAAAPVAVASIAGDAKAGAKVFRKCRACHKIGEGAKNAVGPNMTNVVGRVQGSVESFTKYSDGFKAAMAEGKKWTPAELDAFLTKPKDYMPGTKMAFGGLRKEDDRANVIAYLATNGE